MKFQVNGTELFFDVVGSGLDAASDFRQKPTMILLHGGPGFDHTYLRPWLEPVSEVAQYDQLHIFEHSGHMVFMEEPEELVAVLKQWITSTAGGR